MHTYIHPCIHTSIHPSIHTYILACMHACIPARDPPIPTGGEGRDASIPTGRAGNHDHDGGVGLQAFTIYIYILFYIYMYICGYVHKCFWEFLFQHEKCSTFSNGLVRRTDQNCECMNLVDATRLCQVATFRARHCTERFFFSKFYFFTF